MAERSRGEAETDHAFAVLGAAPLVHADQVGGLHRPAGFLQGLAHRRVDQTLAVFEVPGGLVVRKPAGHVLLDHQVARAVAYHAGHGGVRAPDGVGGGGRRHDGWGLEKASLCHYLSLRSPRSVQAAQRIIATVEGTPVIHGPRTRKRTRKRPWPGSADREAGGRKTTAVPGGTAQ